MDPPAERAAATETLHSDEFVPLIAQYVDDPSALDPSVRAEIEAVLNQARGLTSLQAAFPNAAPGTLGHDLAYPAMLTFLPHGLLGLVVASLTAAYMSTISTHLNWGSSYIVNDFYQRFVRPAASQREQVWIGRVSTVVLMVLAGGVALWLENALQAFAILLQIGAGTGLLFILRWFWWRINPYSELTAMVVSFVVAVYMQFWAPEGLVDWQKLVIGVGITTVSWVLVTLITPADDPQTLRAFYRLTRPGGPGWRQIVQAAAQDGEDLTTTPAEARRLPIGILCMVVGCLAVYSTLFATGYWIYGDTGWATALTVIAIISTAALVRLWRPVTAAT
jgi:SSS family solute:Na+ symporter